MRDTASVCELLIGYARTADDTNDLTAQRDALIALGVGADRVYLNTGMAGANRGRPGLREALAACRAGDTLVVPALSRLARSVPDARDHLVTGLASRQVKLNLGGTIYDPADPLGYLLSDVLGLGANFETDLARARVRAGMAKARVAGRLRGKQPKLNPRQEATSSTSTALANTAPPSSPSCSTSPGPPCIGRSSAPSFPPQVSERARPLVGETRRRRRSRRDAVVWPAGIEQPPRPQRTGRSRCESALMNGNAAGSCREAAHTRRPGWYPNLTSKRSGVAAGVSVLRFTGSCTARAGRVSVGAV